MILMGVAMTKEERMNFSPKKSQDGTNTKLKTPMEIKRKQQACGLWLVVCLLVCQILGFWDCLILQLLVYWFVGLLDCCWLSVCSLVCLVVLVNIGVDCSVKNQEYFLGGEG